MNEQELREKIVKILEEAYEPIEYGDDDIHGAQIYFPSNEDVANALISAGIGDVSEYKHRAEVAERAVREFAVQVGCKSCPFYCRCGIDSPNAKNDYQECYEAILRQAEKELQEERKDD